MSFNWVDALILGVLVISALISLSRGFIKEALSLVTWIVAGIIAWMFGGSLAHHFEPYIDTPSVRVIAACAVLFLATLLIGALVNFLVGLLSLAPVQQDTWWKQSTLIPHFLLIADWSKNLVLGLSGEWISTAQNAQH